jgi:ribonuclease P protein component
VLPKSNRLSGRLVARVFGKGRFVRLPSLSLKFLNNRQNIVRLAVIVPKKIDNRAAFRNRLRRQIVEGIKPIVLESKKSIDITILVSKKQSADILIKELSQWLSK